MMCFWLALNSLMSVSKTLSVLGSSPPPRQQNHLIVTGGPVGSGVGLKAGAELAGAGVATAVDGDTAALGTGVALPPQAENTIAKIANRAAGRRVLVRIGLLACDDCR